MPRAGQPDRDQRRPQRRPGVVRRARAAWPGELYNHSREEVAGFFGGLELVAPGLVVARGWRGGMRDTISPAGPVYAFGGRPEALSWANP
ncbi:MAG: SAM-dependent methyltransferase [Streptosporangiaceae bacterium]